MEPVLSMRSAKALILAIPLVGFALACTSGQGSKSVFWDATGDVRGGDAFMIWETRDLPGLLKIYDAAVVVNVTEITEVKRQDTSLNSITVENPADQAELERHMRNFANMPEQTTYSGEVQTWLQGSGPEKISLVVAGGLTDQEGPDGSISRNQPIFPDGMFLLEPGRTYLLLLSKTETGAYEYGLAFAAFDLTGGVHVLNHPLTRDIEHYEDMSVDDFIAYVKGLADANSVAGN
jgi:hypothetical protein